MMEYFDVFGFSLCEGVKEEGRGLEEIITPLSNWEEVILAGQAAPVDISPHNETTKPPTSG